MLCWEILLLGSLGISQFSFSIKIWKSQFSGTAAAIEISLALLAEGSEVGKEGERNSCNREVVWGQAWEGQWGFTSAEVSRKEVMDMCRECIPCVPISYFNASINLLVQTRAKTDSSPLCSILWFDLFSVLTTCARNYLQVTNILRILWKKGKPRHLLTVWGIIYHSTKLNGMSRLLTS